MLVSLARLDCGDCVAVTAVAAFFVVAFVFVNRSISHVKSNYCLCVQLPHLTNMFVIKLYKCIEHCRCPPISMM